jgi:CRISPR-associated endonuclease Csn1
MEGDTMKYRLGVDLGSTSLGWCIFALDKNGRPSSLLDMGVRIFPDGRDDKFKKPLAVERRGARGMRRNLDRRDLRQKRLIAFLIENGLMPKDEAGRKALEALDPYELRAKALDEKIPLHHLGRALFHINQRRGFKSNLKTDKKANDSGNMKNAIKELDGKIFASGSRTLGEYLWTQRQESQPVRVRSRMVKNKAEYNFYPGREMYLKEVDAILATQRKHHPELTDEVYAGIKDIIFYQRSLRPPVVGKCRFEQNETRIRKAHPLFQKFRILQDVNHLEIERFAEGDPTLDQEDRQKIVKTLMSEKKRTFAELKTLLKISRDCRFNLESERRSELKGDDTAFLMTNEKRFGERWHEFSTDEQEKIIDLLFSEPDPEELVRKLIDDWGLSPEQAEEMANTPLEEGYASLSRKAINKIMPGLEKGLTYDKAVKEPGAYPHHSDFRTGQVYERLPYYGEVLPNSVIGGSNAEEDKNLPEKYWGKINNPTVHIALNQVRKLLNALIDAYGPPEEIVIELARDLKEPVNDVLADQTKNKKENDRINNELEKLGVRQNYRNRMLYKLWEDLCPTDPVKRCCPFSGIQIAPHQIFTGEFEEEHLLPFSKSFNDGRANKVLSSRTANREKGNRTPFEAFSGDSKKWNEILARVQNLPSNKQWRFKEECWDIAKGQGEDIIARQLNDTRYMAKITKQYLSAVFDNEKGKNKVWAIPGQMTALLRDKWGLNDLLGEEDGAKDRTDHRHHAIDAAVTGCTDRGTLQMVARLANAVETKQELWDKRRKLIVDMEEPFEGFRKQIEEKLEEIIVSYKPDHGNAHKAIHAPRPYTVAGLHKASAYGYIRKGDKKGTVVVAERVPLESFEKRDNIEEIADPVIRANVLKAVEGLKEKSVEWKQALAQYSQKTGTRRVRIHFEKTENVLIPVKQSEDRGPEETRGKAYKYYALGGNYCAEIYCPDKGKKAGQWQCEIISNYHAHQKNFIPQWRKDNPTAKLVMRLQINDMVAYEEDGQIVIRRVRKLNNPDKAVFVDHIRAKLEANEGWVASAKQMQLKNVRKVSVDILGRVKDPKAKKQALAAE